MTDRITYEEHTSRYIFARKFVIGKKILDMACGSGYGSKILFDGGAAEVYGCDISEDAIEYAKKNYSNESIKFQVMDASKIKFPDNSFDCVISFETIEHVLDFKNTVKGFHRILKNDGIIIISTPNKELTSKGKEKPPNPFHVKEFTKDEFLDLMSEYFTDVELFSQMLKTEIDIKKKIVRNIISAIISLDVLEFHKRFKKASVYGSMSDYIDNRSRDYAPMLYQSSHKPFIFIAKGKKRYLS